MGWFNATPSPPPTPREAKYSIEKVEERLERFGPMRLNVTDPRVKVLISQITLGTLPYIQMQGDPPTGALLADVMTTLDMLTQVLDGYVKIQNNPSAYQKDGGAEVLMSQGRDALGQFWQKISANSTVDVSDITAYQAVTAYLSGNSASQNITP